MTKIKNAAAATRTETEACAAERRRTSKVACPNCFSPLLAVKAETWCLIDERGRAWPNPIYNFEADARGDSDCRCECGWEGELGNAQDTASECCKCGATPDSFGYTARGERFCDTCGRVEA